MSSHAQSLCSPISSRSSSLEEYQKTSRRDALYAPTLLSLHLSGPKTLKGPQSYFDSPFISIQSRHPASPAAGNRRVLFNYSVVCDILLACSIYYCCCFNVRPLNRSNQCGLNPSLKTEFMKLQNLEIRSCPWLQSCTDFQPSAESGSDKRCHSVSIKPLIP